MSDSILLTISILISDRPDTVRKCLDSIQPLREQVCSELILVDTGCGGQVRSIIEEYTDQIIDFEWCRDFAKARNAGLERARGKWFLYMDDDEWFEDVSAIVRFFNSGEYKIYGVGLYTVRNYADMAGSRYTEMLAGRMIRLEPDIRFIYRIHECFNRAPGRTKRLNAFVHHYGYAYPTAEAARAHGARNIGLLQEELEEHPGNMRLTLQLAQEYNVLEEPEKSLELSLKAIDMAEHGPVEEDYCLSSLYGNAINGYITLYRYDEVIQKGEEYIRSRRTDKMVKALIAGRLAMAFVDKEDYGKALEYAKYYWDVYQAYLANRDAFVEFETPVTQSCFKEPKRTPILGNGVRGAVNCGEAGLAWKWFQDMDWQREKYALDFGVIRDILKNMAGTEGQELEYYEKMCAVLLKRQDLEELVLETVMERCEEGEKFEDRVRAAASYRNMPLEHWFFRLIRLSAAAFLPESGLRYGKEEAEDTAAQLWEVMEESMDKMKDYRLPEAVERLGGDNGRVLEALPFSRWERGVVWYFGHYTWKDALWWQKYFAEAREQDSMHMLLWRSAWGISRASGGAAALERGEEYVLPEGASGPDGVCVSPEKSSMAGEEYEADGRTAEEEREHLSAEAAEQTRHGAMDIMMEGLKEYALCRRALCERIYTDEVIRSMQDVLPEEYRGAYLIADLLERTEAEKYGEAVEAVREIMELLPGLSAIMKHYLKWLERQLELQKETARQASGEFQVLARQIKARVRGLMEAGEYTAALSVIGQLQALLPGDEELEGLKALCTDGLSESV